MRTRRLISSSDPVPSAASDEASAGQSHGHRPQLNEGVLTGHKPVLLHEAVEQLLIRPDDVVLDATLGGAGHARAIAKILRQNGMLIGIDADRSAVARAKDALKDFREPEIHLAESNFRDLSSLLGKLGVKIINKALFDLGWSGYQLDSGRGFSFLKDEPLLMTYSANTGPDALTAGEIVNEWKEENIADVIFGWGEERYSRRIAKKIVERRMRAPIRTSRELGELIKEAVPPAYARGRIHPATRTFQALRIAVNDELGALKSGLQSAWAHLAPGGRIAVITFHSVEDREVKKLMADWEKEGVGKRITRSPIRAAKAETTANPRARSAKLRVIERNF